MESIQFVFICLLTCQSLTLCEGMNFTSFFLLLFSQAGKVVNEIQNGIAATKLQDKIGSLPQVHVPVPVWHLEKVLTTTMRREHITEEEHEILQPTEAIVLEPIETLPDTDLATQVTSEEVSDELSNTMPSISMDATFDSTPISHISEEMTTTVAEHNESAEIEEETMVIDAVTSGDMAEDTVTSDNIGSSVLGDHPTTSEAFNSTEGMTTDSTISRGTTTSPSNCNDIEIRKSKCEHGGICHHVSRSVLSCKCLPGFTGTKCQEEDFSLALTASNTYPTKDIIIIIVISVIVISIAVLVVLCVLRKKCNRGTSHADIDQRNNLALV